MKNRKHTIEKMSFLFMVLLLCFGMDAVAAPSVKGDTDLTAVAGEMVSAEYTITNDQDIESAELTLSYDKEMLTYMSGSGGNNFSGSGGNGSVQLSSRPGSRSATFSVKFKCKAGGETAVEVTACTITEDGRQIDVLKGKDAAQKPEGQEGEESEEEDEGDERASWVIDNRTFYLHNPGELEGFDPMRMDIQGISSRVLKHNAFDLYVVMLFSDNGSYRDHFVYNPDTGNVIPFVQMESGTDEVIFIEPEEGVHVPTRYIPVDMGWGAKYSIPAYKHVIIDGIDEILDDTNRHLVYGINQDGEKAWYSYDYDKNSLQLFDEVAYQGEQNYIDELEVNVEGQKSEAAHLLERYNTNMGRRLMIILFLIVVIVVLLNVIAFMYLRMRRMQMPDMEEDEPEEEKKRQSAAYVTGSLEENETDFQEPFDEDDADMPDEDDIELEIIDLDEMEEED